MLHNASTSFLINSELIRNFNIDIASSDDKIKVYHFQKSFQPTKKLLQSIASHKDPFVKLEYKYKCLIWFNKPLYDESKRIIILEGILDANQDESKMHTLKLDILQFLYDNFDIVSLTDYFQIEHVKINRNILSSSNLKIIKQEISRFKIQTQMENFLTSIDNTQDSFKNNLEDIENNDISMDSDNKKIFNKQLYNSKLQSDIYTIRPCLAKRLRKKRNEVDKFKKKEEINTFYKLKNDYINELLRVYNYADNSIKQLVGQSRIDFSKQNDLLNSRKRPFCDIILKPFIKIENADNLNYNQLDRNTGKNIINGIDYELHNLTRVQNSLLSARTIFLTDYYSILNGNISKSLKNNMSKSTLKKISIQFLYSDKTNSSFNIKPIESENASDINLKSLDILDLNKIGNIENINGNLMKKLDSNKNCNVLQCVKLIKPNCPFE